MYKGFKTKKQTPPTARRKLKDKYPEVIERLEKIYSLPFIVTLETKKKSLTHILDFLVTQFHEGKEYRTINVYCSALSAVLPLIDGHKVGSHPLVYQMLKGVYQLHPPQPRYATTWQVSRIVKCILSLGPNAQLSSKRFSYKLVGLLALTAPDRASGLAACVLHYRCFHP